MGLSVTFTAAATKIVVNRKSQKSKVPKSFSVISCFSKWMLLPFLFVQETLAGKQNDDNNNSSSSGGGNGDCCFSFSMEKHQELVQPEN